MTRMCFYCDFGEWGAVKDLILACALLLLGNPFVCPPKFRGFCVMNFVDDVGVCM